MVRHRLPRSNPHKKTFKCNTKPSFAWRIPWQGSCSNTETDLAAGQSSIPTVLPPLPLCSLVQKSLALQAYHTCGSPRSRKNSGKTSRCNSCNLSSRPTTWFFRRIHTTSWLWWPIFSSNTTSLQTGSRWTLGCSRTWSSSTRICRTSKWTTPHTCNDSLASTSKCWKSKAWRS